MHTPVPPAHSNRAMRGKRKWHLQISTKPWLRQWEKQRERLPLQIPAGFVSVPIALSVGRHHTQAQSGIKVLAEGSVVFPFLWQFLPKRLWFGLLGWSLLNTQHSRAPRINFQIISTALNPKITLSVIKIWLIKEQEKVWSHDTCLNKKIFDREKDRTIVR